MDHLENKTNHSSECLCRRTEELLKRIMRLIFVDTVLLVVTALLLVAGVAIQASRCKDMSESYTTFETYGENAAIINNSRE